MTDEEREQIWNALHSGRMAAHRAHGLTKHTEGASELFRAVEKEICDAMDLINKA